MVFKIKVYLPPEDLLSISSDCKECDDLISELSRPLRKYDASGRIKVESKEEMRARGVDSPNLADMMIYAFDPEALPDIEDKWAELKYEKYSTVSILPMITKYATIQTIK